jgi:hypothetical protein
LPIFDFGRFWVRNLDWKFFCSQFYALIVIAQLIHLSLFPFSRTKCLPMLVQQRADDDVSRRLCSCIDVEQVKEKPWRGGQSVGGDGGLNNQL